MILNSADACCETGREGTEKRYSVYLHFHLHLHGLVVSSRSFTFRIPIHYQCAISVELLEFVITLARPRSRPRLHLDPHRHPLNVSFSVQALP